MTEPTVKRRKITDYQPDPHNANRGTERGYRMLDDSIRESGAARSLVAAADDTIPAGNKTMQALVDAGIEDVIEIETDGTTAVVVKRTDWPSVDSPAARKYAYQDNRTSQVGLDWNPEQILADLDAGIDLSALWQDDELDALLAGVAPEPSGGGDPGAQLDRAEELREKWQTARGQVWAIPSATVTGKCHRIMCGDSTSADDVEYLMDGDLAQGCFTSPPYAEQRKDQYGGIPTDEYIEWWKDVQANVKANIRENGSFFVNIKPHIEEFERSLYVMDLVVTMRRQWGWMFIDEFCWLRAGVPKMVRYRFKNAFEPIYQFAVSKDFKFRPKAVQHDSYNVPIPRGEGAGNTNWAGWQGAASDAQGITGKLFGELIEQGKAYPSNVLKAWSNTESLNHPAAFAVKLVEFFLLAYSDVMDLWYEPFCGSGTTVVSAEQNKRLCYGMEISEAYCAVILERLAGMGLEPRLADGSTRPTGSL